MSNPSGHARLKRLGSCRLAKPKRLGSGKGLTVMHDLKKLGFCKGLAVVQDPKVLGLTAILDPNALDLVVMSNQSGGHVGPKRLVFGGHVESKQLGF